MKQYITFLIRCFRLSFVGPPIYYVWMFALSVMALLGLNAYAKQFVHGMGVTGMSDQVSWGLYIANFAFLVGMAAAVTAVAMVVAGGPQGIETLDHMLQVDSAITSFQERTGAPPTDLAQLSLPADMLKDGWGRPIEYRLEGSAPEWKWSIRSAGADGVMDPDDLTFRGTWAVSPDLMDDAPSGGGNSPDQPIFVANAAAPTPPARSGASLVVMGCIVTAVVAVLALVAGAGFALHVMNEIAKDLRSMQFNFGGAFHDAAQPSLGVDRAAENARRLQYIGDALEEYERLHGQPPTSLDQLNIGAGDRNDVWGVALEYRLVGSPPRWQIRSAGPDGQFDPADPWLPPR